MIRHTRIIWTAALMLGLVAACSSDENFGGGGANGITVRDANGAPVAGATVWIPAQQNNNLLLTTAALGLTTPFGLECDDPSTDFVAASCTDQNGFAANIGCMNDEVINIGINGALVDNALCSDIENNSLNLSDFYVHPLVLVPNLDQGTVSVISSETQALVDTYEVDGAATALALTPDGETAYVGYAAAPDGGVPPFGIDVINAETGSGVTVIDLEGALPVTLEVSPDGSWAVAGVLVSEEATDGPGGPGFVAFIDTATNELNFDTVYPVQGFPTGIAGGVDPDIFYVSHADLLGAAGSLEAMLNGSGDGQPFGVAVIDPIAGVQDDIDFTSYGFPIGMVVTPDASRLYVVAAGKGSSFVEIDTSDNTVVDDLFLDSIALNAAISPDGTTAYVTEFGPANQLNVIDLESFASVDTIDLGDLQPLDVRLSPDGQTAFVLVGGGIVDGGLNVVVAVNLEDQSVSDPIDVGSGSAFPLFLSSLVGVQGN